MIDTDHHLRMYYKMILVPIGAATVMDRFPGNRERPVWLRLCCLVGRPIQAQPGFCPALSRQISASCGKPQLNTAPEVLAQDRPVCSSAF